MSDGIDNDYARVPLYWGYFDLSAEGLTFSTSPDPDELVGLLVHHAFTSPGVGELNWGDAKFIPVPGPLQLFEAALRHLPDQVARQAVQIRAFCRYEYIVELARVATDVDWIVIDMDGNWHYPSGELMEEEEKIDFLSVSGLMREFDIGPDPFRHVCVAIKLTYDSLEAR